MPECVKESFWCYLPNKGAPIAFAILYFISAVGHIYQAWRYRAKWAIPLVVGTIFTTVGFGFKAYSSHHVDQLIPWIVGIILLFTAPPIYAAADYFAFAKLSHYVPSQAPMNPSRIVTTFVAMDGLCELIMGTGIGQVVNHDKPKRVSIGNTIIKVGLLLQIALFAGFVYLMWRFHRNVRRVGLGDRPFMKVVYVLYASSACISIRCLYRVVEFFEGVDGTIYRTEAYFHVFEASLMWIHVIILNIWHPGRFLPMSNSIYLNEKGEEIDGGSGRGGWEDNRPLIVSLLDPFNLQGLFNDFRAKQKAKRNGGGKTEDNAEKGIASNVETK